MLPFSNQCFTGLILVILLVGPSTVEASAGGLTVDGGALRDAEGRQLFLWGMNVGEKSSARRHASWHGPDDFLNLRRWGMNAVRLLIFWSAVEPEPGQYDDNYLESVDQRIAWAWDAGLHVVLDMHQDLWSEAIPGGNGAPAWATLDDGMPHRTIGGAWSTAYFTSPRVHRAFDNFWANAPGPDGVGIQDRFALAWRHVAARYVDTPAVIGINIMNEPFPGSPIREAALALWRAIPDIFRGMDMPDGFGALLESLGEHPYPGWLLDALDDPARHRRALEAIEPVMHRFEKERLTPMYRRVHAAVREVHPTILFFLEPCVLANVGTHTAITRLTDDAGAPDPWQVYMPHAYDIVVDTRLSHQPSANRLNVIFSHKYEDAQRLDLPLFIGEWGAYYGNDRTRNAARLSLGHIVDKTTGAFYWDYHRNVENAVYFECLARPAPLAVAGTHLASEFDLDSGVFRCSWANDPAVAAPSLFAAPRAWSTEPPEIRVEPEELTAQVVAHPDDPETVHVIVDASETTGTITLTLTPVR